MVVVDEALWLAVIKSKMNQFLDKKYITTQYAQFNREADVLPLFL